MILANAIPMISMDVITTIKKGMATVRYASADQLDRRVQVKYVIEYHDMKHRRLCDILLHHGILEKIYVTARSFLLDNRPKYEIQLFDTLHPNR